MIEWFKIIRYGSKTIEVISVQKIEPPRPFQFNPFRWLDSENVTANQQPNRTSDLQNKFPQTQEVGGNLFAMTDEEVAKYFGSAILKDKVCE